MCCLKPECFLSHLLAHILAAIVSRRALLGHSDSTGHRPWWPQSPGWLICLPILTHQPLPYLLALGTICRASLVAQLVKNPPAMWETWFDPWVGKIPWRRAWQPTTVSLPGESPWTEKPGGLWSMWLQRVRHDWVTKHSTAQVLYVETDHKSH